MITYFIRYHSSPVSGVSLFIPPVSKLTLISIYSFSKYFWLTGLTMKCSMAPTPTSPAMVYMVVL